MTEHTDFRQLQYQFAAHIRDPQHQPAPDDIESRRMAIYRRLFFNNLDNFISNAFPVIRQLHDDQQWQSLIRDFMVEHRCHSPLFHQIAAEFVQYLNQRPVPAQQPFLNELAHYEWLELALSVVEYEIQASLPDTVEALMSSYWQMPPTAVLQLYHYPVHQIGVNHQPQQPSEQPCCLLVYRDPTDKVRFVELNAVSARLLDLVNQGLSGYEAAEQIAIQLQHPDSQQLATAAAGLISDWCQNGVLSPADR
ncbi:hypothetical protein MPL1_04802 [Methylophaga lonarensis MPL]|uniref:Uncharacterized protein n=1 Tax=Methylophaga lonarensis MPL TaxID=1286106 RepID=M7NXD5_9GAMM|nr:putative DNA-binding domain-containing protein [Methylophaga lonarensis]EMR13448.1 hypothetical protein MPL1_04802 [Methylophaga lonarensis MPL]